MERVRGAEIEALPDDVIDLENWLADRLREVDAAALAAALEEAEAIASRRFSPGDVVAAVRHVWATELAAG